ncbi:beta strand repeat-containing protein [Sphingobium baderi]|uniref:RapA2 cadherin-like domain-containing protein n=1 Tax=Sphingobium baderi TaxID=1332080 RepID=A0A0S3EYA2_9SPHN|nr:VCBS domain-containing protein [Sphingobium baderi]ALR20436.1 hypothetical protein ATN00_09055 [Sphingobium baderi]
MDFERDWDVSAADDRQPALGNEVSAALRVQMAMSQPGRMQHITPGPDGVVVLPAGTDLNQIHVVGRDLVVALPDGTQILIEDGAVFVPRLVLGDVEVPTINLAALLVGEEPQPAAGPPQSSGGNFAGPPGDIGDRHGLGDLLPPTELVFTQPEQREIIPVAPDDDDQPEVTIVTPNQPAGVSDASANVSEAGLGPREGEPAGSASAGNSETTSGTIVISSQDQPATVTINGVVVTAVGQTITTDIGVLTITSMNNGTIGYSYTLTDNIIGPPPAEIFTVVVTDADGDQATATLTIFIADDVPTAVNDVDSVTEDGPLVADGNVLTGVGGGDANGTDGVADVQGADGAVVSTTGTFQGSYGVLTLNADGSYSYTLANGNPAVQALVPGQTLTENFNYTITDGDGDTSTATLTITINGADDGVTITGLDRDPGVNGAEEVVLESDLADGSSPDAAALTQQGSFSIAAADGLATVTIGGVAVLSNGGFVAGQVITTPQGTLTITGFTPTSEAGGAVTAGTFTYTYVLTDNSLDHSTPGADSLFQSFDVVATDRNGSSDSATLDIRIVDDVPTAHDDVDGVAAGSYGPEGGNVITGAGTVSGAAGADVKGADGAVVAGVAAGAGGTAQVAAGSVGTAIAGAYGTLTLNADGSYSYVRAAGTPGGVSDSFTYTLRDGDGDLSAATLRIDIADSQVVIISIPRVGDGTVVDEAGLDDPVGSNAAADVETTNGTITYSSPDGPSTITINGTVVTAPGQTIVTDKGVLTITGLTDGGIDYSYTLTDSTTGDDVTDSFQVTITDVDGDSATDTLVITILDDVPTAANDVDSVREDGPLVADGNVMTGSGGTDANGTDGVADVPGADGAAVTGIAFGGTAGAVGALIAGAYGTLQIEADGSYRYVLNNGNGVVQGLDSNQTLTETFTYTLTDGDGDTSSATLTITIQGRNDGVTITGLDGQGAEETVFENDLAEGSSPDAAALAQTGSFTLSALDGVSTITVGGQSIFANGAFTGATISNAYGSLQITGFTPVIGADGDVIGGEVSYTYTLNDNTLLHTGGNDGSLTESFAVIVTDTDGSTDNASLDIRVVDDVPVANDDSATQPSENAPVLINVFANDVAGADGVNLASGVVLESAAAKGTVVYQGNGVFLYTPAAGAEGQDSFTYTITDRDGDQSTATVTITLAGDSEPTVRVSDLTVSEAGLPDGTQAASDLETDSGTMTIATGGDALAKVAVQDKDGNWIDVTAATAGSPIVVAGAGGQLTVTSDGAGHYSYSYTLTDNDPTHPDNDPGDGDGISGAADPKAGDSFAVRVTDSDGDVSPTDHINVTVLDDAPTLTVDGQISVVEGATATGTWSQVIGADQPGASTVVVVGANSYAIGAPINTGLGTLTVNANGTWSFVSSNNLDNDLNPSLSFTVKVTDVDGDVAQDTQTIAIADGAGPAAGGPLTLALDDQNLADGTTPGNPDFASGTVSFTAGSDALTGFAFAAGTGALGGGLTWNRVSGTLIEGWDGPVGTGTKIVSLALSAPASIGAGLNGTVTVTATLLDNYDSHPGINLDDLVALGNIGVVASDQDGDSATATVNLTVSDDVPTLMVDGQTSVVEGAAATGTWSQVIGADQPGASTVVVVGANSYAIGAPINTGLGTLTVNANGTWSFVSSNNLDNDLNPSLSFTVKVTDADGDVAQDTQTIAIADGAGPAAGGPLTLALDDQNLADGTTPGNPDFASGTVSFTAGSDALTGFAFAAGTGALGGGLTWNRVSGTLIEGWDGPVGTGTKIVSLALSAPASIGAGLNGTVTVTATLLDNYDSHPGINLDDLVALGNIGVVASDQDGDSATATVNLTVSDDVPTLMVDGQTSVVEGAAATGTWSQVIGADQPGASTVVVVGANSYAIGAPINTGLGTLTVNANGTWSFVSSNNLDNDLNPSLSFTVKVTDADGDVAQDTQTIAIADGAGPAAGGPLTLALDDQNLADGTTPGNPDFASGTVSFTAGSDALTGFAFAAGTGALGGGLTWNRVSGTLIEGWDGPVGTGTKIVSLALSAPASIGAGLNGTVTVTATLLDNYDSHPGINLDDLVALGNIGVVASDQDGDSATATVNLTVSDDVPTLMVDGQTSVVEGAAATGTWSQVIGADQPGASTVVVVGANSYAIGAPINTGLGTLTVNANGTWSFVSSNNLDNDLNPSLSFTVKVTDADGDVAQDTQTIAIADGAGPAAGGPLTLALDDQNLADGTTPGNPDFASGTVSFTAGSDALTGFAFAAGTGALGGGLTWNRVSGTLIEGWDGPVGTGTKIVSLALSAPASIGAGLNGTVTVTATLLDNYDSHPGINLDDLVALGNIGVVASDQDGDSATATVNLTVSDDVPVALATAGEARGPELITVDNVNGNFATGQFSMHFGADGASSSGFNITGPTIAGVHYTETDVFNPMTGQFLRTELLAEVGGGGTPGTADDLFKLTVNADGSYRFDLINAEQVTTETISFASLGAGGPGFRELADDSATTGVNEAGRVEFQSNGTNGVNASTPGFGVDNQWTDPGEWFSMEFHNPGTVGNDPAWVNPDLLDSITFGVQQVQHGPVDFTWTAIRYNSNGSIAATESGSFTANAAGQITVDPTIQFSEFRIENVDTNGAVRFSTAVSVGRLVLPTDQNLAFQVNGTDGDGDPMAPITIGVFVDATPSPIPPIAFDLDGDGLEFLGLAAGVSHDYGSGEVATAWVASDDGLLAHATEGGYDVNFADDVAGATSDLEGLRLAYDSNGNGLLDAGDAAFNEFGVWQDANSDGKVDAGEYVSLTDAGIQSIQLISDGQAYTTANGDVKVVGEATYTKTDGSTGAVGDVVFATATRDTDSSKIAAASTVASGLNQALIAASLIAAADLKLAPEHVDPLVQHQDGARAGDADQLAAAQGGFEALTPIASATTSPSDALADDPRDGAQTQAAERTSHGAEEASVDHAGLAGGDGAATASADNAGGSDQSAPLEHQALLAQPINLANFDGAAAMLPAHQAAIADNAATAAQVVTEALGQGDAPNIEALLAALPAGPHAIPLFNAGAAELLDGGHLAALAHGAGGAFDAAMAMHEAMAVAHG